MRTFPALALVALAISCGGCPPEEVKCLHQGETHEVGDVFAAGDGCNQCLCNEQGNVVCSAVQCQLDGGTAEGGGEDGGAVVDGSADAADIGPITNVVVPYPQESCSVVSVNAAAPTGALVPGDVVVVTAASYPPPTPGGSVARVDWSLVRAPAGSHAFAFNRVGTETALRSNNLQGADLAGTYALRAVLTDDAGATAVHDCKLAFQPTHSFYAELVWDTVNSDLDIRAIKQGADGHYCSQSPHRPAEPGLTEPCRKFLQTLAPAHWCSWKGRGVRVRTVAQ